MRGRVKFYSPKGYGFIAAEAGEDYFVHISAVTDGRPELVQGDEVLFDLEPGQKGMKAVNVTVINGSDR
jgi:CspA family cold shock protein